MTDYEDLDATGLAEAVATGNTTPDALLDAALERAGRWQPHLNALCHVDEDMARGLIAQGLPDGPLRGVPFLLKDIGCETPDFPVTNGSRLAPGRRYRQNSTVYARLRAAGAVPFGRTTTPESAIGPVTEAAVYGGPTRNPWALDRTPGGSSGGAGAAVAAGIVPAAHGSDGGGSIRIPASCCGLVGMKPSRARIPDGPYAGEGWGGMAMDGVLTRSVRDQARLLDILSGPDLGAPYFPPPLGESFADALSRDNGPLRIAVCTTTYGGAPIHADCRAAVGHAADLLDSLGHRLEDAAPIQGVEDMMRAWTRIVACGTESWVRAEEAAQGKGLRDLLEPVAQGACLFAQGLSGADYLDAVNAIHTFGRRMAAYFDDGPDILLSAVLAEPPARIGRFAHANEAFGDFEAYRLGPGGIFDYSPLTPVFNASGQPAISLPLYRTEANLPIGVQLAAPMGGDEMLIALAAAVETALPWAHHAPAPPGG